MSMTDSDIVAKKAGVFVPFEASKPSLMFLSGAGLYQRCPTVRVSFDLKYLIKTWLKNVSRDQHSCLFVRKIGDGERQFFC
jgi:hypothetical protein